MAPEVAEQRIAAVAAGGTVADDSDVPSLTMIADQDGNTGVVCVAEPPATEDWTADWVTCGLAAGHLGPHHRRT
ncbi:hypothetical protein ACI3ET_12000 [Ornithinimicrobium sp. LYQ121]|uniref:hypothetical protein n=1 Tax=Ornithinimicrobium sp. LYQ121 TaxID=3378801 RepID=UPI0038555DA5